MIQKSLEQIFFDNRGVTEDHIMRYLWAESCKHSRLASVSGKKACQYSTIFLRFAITLRSKMKDKMFEIVSKAFHSPSIRTLSDYCFPGAHDLDGICTVLSE